MRVSLPLTAEGGRIRAAVAALCAALAVALAATVAVPAAHAEFTIAPCHGSGIQGEGSSLQKVAQTEFWTPSVFYTSNGCGAGAATLSPVTYVADGSGCGIASLGGGPTSAECSDFNKKGETPVAAGYRDPLTRFAGSDGPLTPTQKANAEAVSSEHPGVIHQIPVASAAVTVVVHFPEGCSLEDPAQVGGNGNTSTGAPNDPSGKSTTDSFAEETLRVHVTAEEMEKIWDGAKTQTWGDILGSHVTGKPTNALNSGFTSCGEVPVRRIVRLDGSGTTYNFKAYLSLLPGAPANLWTTAPVVGESNVWPVTETSKETPAEVNKSTNVCEDASDICHGTKNGGGSLAAAVQATDGSIGYLDLATARHNGFDIEKKKADHTYWIPLQTINPTKPEGQQVGANFVEPTASPASNIAGSEAPHGANCTEADYRGIPATPAGDPTLGDWSKAIATGSLDEVTYPACALTYDFAFDDDSMVYGNTQAEQEKARTVKDYLTAVESSLGQVGLASADYGVLSSTIQKIGQKGVEAIGWNKAAGSGGSKEEVKTPPPTEEKSGGGGGVTPPNNAFSIAGAKVKGKSIVLSLVLPGPGTVSISALGGGVKVSQLTASVSGGNGVVTLSISKAALTKLAKIKGHKLVVKITITFTPTGGTAATQSKTVTLTQAPAKKGKHHGKSKHKGKKK